MAAQLLEQVAQMRNVDKHPQLAAEVAKKVECLALIDEAWRVVGGEAELATLESLEGRLRTTLSRTPGGPERKQLTTVLKRVQFRIGELNIKK